MEYIVTVYNLSKQPKKQKTVRDRNKIIGIILLVISSIAFLSLLTSFIEFLKSFLLGVFGLFSYPLFITVFVIGLALVNNKKYVMTAKYIVYLLCALVSLLCILHMLFIDKSGTFFEYLGRCYTQKMTVGGIFCGILTAPLIFLLNDAGAYIIYSIVLIIFGALLADYIFYLNKSQAQKKPINISPIPQIENDVKSKKEIKVPAPNIVLDAKLKNELLEDGSKRKIGYIATNIEDTATKQSTDLPALNDKEALKKYLFNRDDTQKIDMAKYKGQKPNISANKIQENINILKKQEAPSGAPSKIVHDFSSAINEQPVQYNEEKSYIAPVISAINKEEENQKTNNNQNTEDFADALESLIKDAKLDTETKPLKPENNRRGLRGLGLNSEYQKPKMEQQKIETQPLKPKKSLRYNRPSLELLTTRSMDLSELNDDVMLKRQQLENALDTFGIPAKVIDVIVGPAVTRYELEMPAGISVKKILAHSDDIALNLAANGDIRIEAPIPGKSAVGIEVPNEKIATVGLHDIMASNEFQNAKAPLTFVLGKDISGSVRLCNLAKMPHLLVAGSTGSGKSVCLNAIILSLIYKTSPDDVRLILIDPKQVEFSIYNGLPHLLIPNVITDPDKALNALSWAVGEMERRYTLFKDTRTKDITEYNSCSAVLEGNSEKMPYIVVIVDELADLLMSSKKDVEERLTRLAAKSRAAGIHLILATQRPSVDVITGTMKNNFPSRISFKLMSFADSRTILDQGGAEKLLGRGDMLYKPNDAPEPRRIQGCFVTSTEVANIVDFVKENNQDYDYDDKVETQIINPPTTDIMSNANSDTVSDGFDPLMPQALKCVIENGQASISMLQRRLVIGYPRAARIIDQMQDHNFISPQDGSKPRTVLITMEQYQEMFGDDD